MILFEIANKRREVVLEWHHSASWASFKVERPASNETIVDFGKFTYLCMRKKQVNKRHKAWYIAFIITGLLTTAAATAVSVYDPRGELQMSAF